MSKRKPGAVYIRFWDHALGPANEHGLIECEVFGLLYKEDELTYYVAVWICNRDVTNHNTEVISIAKSTVQELRRLK